MKISICFLIGLFLMACSKPSEKKVERVRPVKHLVLSKKGVQETHTFAGSAQAKEEAKLSFKVAGTVDRIFVKVGDLVGQGQVIAAIEATDYQVSLQQAQAQEQGAQASEQSSETQIKSAEANFIAARSSYQRITSLYENNSVSLSEFEQTKANYEAARAQYDAAKAQYEAAQFNTTASLGQKQSAENQVRYTKLVAPFSGVVSQQHVEENELVNSGSPVITLSSIGKSEVVVGVPEMLISKVKKEAVVKVAFSTLPGQSFDAKVIEVGYSPGSGATYPITTDLLTNSDAIRPGMPANVTFSFDLPADQANKIIAPTAAIGEDTAGRFVFKLEKRSDGKAEVKRQAVTIGKLRNEGFEILEGLKEGDMIAAAGLNILLDGDVVRL